MACQFRFVENYAFQPEVYPFASSESSEFPASNIAQHSRSKVWRSAGYFVITSSNRKIDFKESGGGSELTATLTTGNYTADALETEIKAQMELVGAETYTVTFTPSTGKWTIATGGAFLSLLFVTGTNTANSVASTIGFTDTADATGAATYTGPSVAIHTEEGIVLDLGTWETNGVDSVIVLFDPVDGIKLSEAATVTLQASQTDHWTSPAVSQSLTIDETFDCASHFFSSVQNYRYWRLKIVDPRNPYLYVEIAKFIVGYATQLTQVPDVGFRHAVVDQSIARTNLYGNEFYDVYSQRQQVTFNYSVLAETDVLTLYNIFQRCGKVKPFVLSLDSSGDLFDKDRFLVYGRFAGDFTTTHRFYSYFDSEITVRETL